MAKKIVERAVGRVIRSTTGIAPSDLTRVQCSHFIGGRTLLMRGRKFHLTWHAKRAVRALVLERHLHGAGPHDALFAHGPADGESSAFVWRRWAIAAMIMFAFLTVFAAAIGAMAGCAVDQYDGITIDEFDGFADPRVRFDDDLSRISTSRRERYGSDYRAIAGPAVSQTTMPLISPAHFTATPFPLSETRTAIYTPVPSENFPRLYLTSSSRTSRDRTSGPTVSRTSWTVVPAHAMAPASVRAESRLPASDAFYSVEQRCSEAARHLRLAATDMAAGAYREALTEVESAESAAKKANVPLDEARRLRLQIAIFELLDNQGDFKGENSGDGPALGPAGSAP